jgi:cysteinyl-tRNA synthetase
MTALRLFNTWTRQITPFTTRRPKEVGFYSCGPTVYNYAHIGNLRTYVFADLVRRVLRAEGYDVRHVMNITDVGHLTSDADTGEDKMEKGARQQGRTAWEIADFYTEAFKHDLTRLDILEPTIWCKATDHIPQMIETVRQIEANGHTYRTSDGIYFDTATQPEYGHLARLDIAGQQAGARVAVNEEKRNPQDFALWKFSTPEEGRQMEWDSPWGRGFPGWHIECSAMAAEYLGVPFDVHSGGVDHIPVHHTNEIAQTRAATGLLLADWWLHGEFLVLKDKRMGKSEGNFLTLQTLVDAGYAPMAYRYLTYTAHYRSHLTYSEEAIDAASSALRTVHNLFSALPVEPGVTSDERLYGRFRDTLRDDLNAPQALAVVWETLRDTTVAPAIRRVTLLAMDEVLPLGLAHVDPAAEPSGPPAEVEALLAQRLEARAAKDWKTSDAVRGAIAALGWEVRDTPQGQVATLARE